MSPLKAAVDGTIEVAHPVIFSVLTTMVAFWPLLMGSGIMGKLMRNLPIVVIFVLFGSLVESLFILPAHLSRKNHVTSRLESGTKKEEKRMSKWLKDFIRGPYTRTVNFCVRWRYATIGLGVAVLLLTLGMVQGGVIKFTFFPKVESDTLDCSVTMPAGTPMERTIEVVTYLEETAQEMLKEGPARHCNIGIARNVSFR